MAILIVEDDPFYGRRLAEILGDNDVEVIRACNAEDALKVEPHTYEAAIIDVMLPNDPSLTGITVEESRAGFLTGVAIARQLRKNRTDLKVVLITGDVWGSEAERWAESQGIPLVLKSDGERAIRDVLRRLGVLKDKPTPRAFIVHGHDEVALLQLKNYLQNNLKWPEPVVLRERPNQGKTIIEKFEDFGEQIDCVFVLLTPDDLTPNTPSDTRRARQNVIFELGFFFAQFGRRSGRTIVLHKGPTELPSDIQGIAWIGIDQGVESAGEEIRREVAPLLSGK